MYLWVIKGYSEVTYGRFKDCKDCNQSKTLYFYLHCSSSFSVSVLFRDMVADEIFSLQFLILAFNILIYIKNECFLKCAWHRACATKCLIKFKSVRSPCISMDVLPVNINCKNKKILTIVYVLLRIAKSDLLKIRCYFLIQRKLKISNNDFLGEVWFWLNTSEQESYFYWVQWFRRSLKFLIPSKVRNQANRPGVDIVWPHAWVKHRKYQCDECMDFCMFTNFWIFQR